MVSTYLDFAESMAERHIPLTMEDWETRLNSFIQLFDYGLLGDAGKVTAEIAKLRAISTRAIITPGGFTNHYEWGDLKADPADWMRRYFDAFVYSANWCSCHLSLRLPKAAFDKAELPSFITQTTFSVECNDTHWILDWTLDENEDYGRFAGDDGSGWMRRLIPLRDELLRGDLRPLYLGWLAGWLLTMRWTMMRRSRTFHRAWQNCRLHNRLWSNSWRSIRTCLKPQLPGVLRPRHGAMTKCSTSPHGWRPGRSPT